MAAQQERARFGLMTNDSLIVAICRSIGIYCEDGSNRCRRSAALESEPVSATAGSRPRLTQISPFGLGDSAHAHG